MHSNTTSTVNILPNIKLSELTTFRLGGPCQGLIHCQTPEELKNAINFLAKEQKDFILIGGGSNLVVSDQGIDCHVIRYVSEKPLIERNDLELAVSGSTSLDALSQYAADNGLEGINCCTGIPGTVGGAVVGNAGAFGKQIGDVVKSVELITRDGQSKVVKGSDLGFKYRHSDLKQSTDIVVSATLSLSQGDSEQLLAEREEILKVRQSKHPDLSKEPCAGSFFRNIEPTSKAGKRQAAGWFLDQAGGKSLTHGGAYIYDKHANIIIKGENCTAEDVYQLSQQMAALAKKKFDLDLIREVRFVGPFQANSTPSHPIW